MPVTRACDQCGRTYSRSPSMLGKYCSPKCKSESQKREDSPYRRIITDWSHPLSNEYGQVKEHRWVLYKKIGPGTHNCHWCGRQVIWLVGVTGGDTLIADHVDRDYLNNDPTNLVPSCTSCNVHRDRAPAQYTDHLCQVCGKSFKVLTCSNNASKYCSRACMYRRNKQPCLKCGVLYPTSKPKLIYKEAGYCSRICYASKASL